MRGRVVAGGLLHLVEAALLAAEEEEQERQVEERERRKRAPHPIWYAASARSSATSWRPSSSARIADHNAGHHR